MPSNVKTLYHLLLKPVRGADHAARMERFYAGQAEGYDRFRRRLLAGRRELFESIETPRAGIWIDMGGGTGACLEHLGPQIAELKKVYIVDLSPSMLAVAKERIGRCGWRNVETVVADATTFRPAEGHADVVTFSYSLTMIPDWFAALENAMTILRPEGRIGVVDFYVARKHPARGLKRYSWFTRWFWPVWFAAYNVFLSPDHVPFLHGRFDVLHFEEGRAKVPYVPLLRLPYFTFVGRNRGPGV